MEASAARPEFSCFCIDQLASFTQKAILRFTLMSDFATQRGRELPPRERSSLLQIACTHEVTRFDDWRRQKNS
jgi:hypothetical protein